MGFIVFGHDDSPVVPVILYQPAKIAAFVRAMTQHGVARPGPPLPQRGPHEGDARPRARDYKQTRRPAPNQVLAEATHAFEDRVPTLTASINPEVIN